MISTIIVDDEWLVRAELRNLLEDFDFIEIVGEASNVGEAIEIIETQDPQLLFLAPSAESAGDCGPKRPAAANNWNKWNAGILE